jgi:hypothetical protein
MLESVSINFSPEIRDFVAVFEDKIKNLVNFDYLIIDNTPTFSNALKLLSEINFKQYIVSKPNLFAIIIKVNEQIDESHDDQPQIHDFTFKDHLLISYQSTIGKHESKSYWKGPGFEKFKTIYIDDDENEVIASFFCVFIIDEIKTGRMGKKIGSRVICVREFYLFL